MQAEQVTMDPAEALDLYREYKKHRHYARPIDDEIRRTYRLLSQGRLIIRALDTIAKAGLNEQGYPKLAIVRADAEACHLMMRHDGSAIMAADQRGTRRGSGARDSRFEWPRGTFVSTKSIWHAEARSPGVPLRYRPQKGIENYHILWEAEWQPVIPHDPYLLRRLGHGDLWLVTAMWALTEVERAALAGRL